MLTSNSTDVQIFDIGSTLSSGYIEIVYADVNGRRINPCYFNDATIELDANENSIKINGVPGGWTLVCRVFYVRY